MSPCAAAGIGEDAVGVIGRSDRVGSGRES